MSVTKMDSQEQGCYQRRNGHRSGHELSITCRQLCLIVLILVFIPSPSPVSSSRVFELSDRFLDTYRTLLPNSNGWIIKFYAPWCHFCRKLEPVYMKLAQKLDELNLPVHVGRVDCTKFETMSTTFNVRGFPTIKYIAHDKVVEFNGDRSLEELIDFANRMTGPKIRTINHCSQLDQMLAEIPSFMAYFGKSVSNPFQVAADTFHSNIWFFHCTDTCAPRFKEGWYSIKGSPDHVHAVKFDDGTLTVADGQEKLISEDDHETNETVLNKVSEFVSKHRFPQFVKMTVNNMNSLLGSGSDLIIALVDEYEPNQKLYTAKDEHFKKVVESVAMEYFDEDIIFGWSSNLDMINSLTMYSLTSVPTIVVIEGQSTMYHIWSPKSESDSSKEVEESKDEEQKERVERDVAKEDILLLINEIKAGTLPLYGGNDMITRIKRRSYDAFNNLVAMYQGNPVLTLLVFGLPLSFLSFIIYSSCFGDMIDVSEDDDDVPEDDVHERHEKKD